MKLIFRSPLKSWGFGNIQVTLTWKHQCPDEKAQSWDLAWAFWLATNPSTPDHCPSPIALLACELSASVEHNFLLLFSHSVVSDFCDPMDCSMPGFLLHHLPEFAQTHVHWVSDAIQPFHSLSSLPAFNLSQHQGLFQWVGSLHEVAKILELEHQSFQWIFKVEFL